MATACSLVKSSQRIMQPLACCSRVHDTDDGGGLICRIFALGSFVVSSSLDILQLFPDLAAIGPLELQVYCDEWLQRPVAQECGIVKSSLMSGGTCKCW